MLKTKPGLRFLLLLLVSFAAGYFIRKNTGPDLFRPVFYVLGFAGVLFIPMIVELVKKSKTAKTGNEAGIKISKTSGYLFVVGAILFSIRFGYLLAQ